MSVSSYEQLLERYRFATTTRLRWISRRRWRRPERDLRAHAARRALRERSGGRR